MNQQRHIVTDVGNYNYGSNAPFINLSWMKGASAIVAPQIPKPTRDFDILPRNWLFVRQP